LKTEYTLSEFYNTLFHAANKFKHYLEHNAPNEFLYKKLEKDYQNYFDMILDQYPFITDREVSCGNGKLDFIIRHFQSNVVVEMKLTSNSKWQHSIQRQLFVYMDNKNATVGIFILIINSTKIPISEYQERLQNSYVADKIHKIELIVIDARLKPKPSD
jgi:hypothetical protein